MRSVEDLTAAARRIHEISGAAVLAKGGMHLPGPDAVDVFVDGDTVEVLSAPKIGQSGVSGAGCSLAAAVTAELAKGATTLEAARRAKGRRQVERLVRDIEASHGSWFHAEDAADLTGLRAVLDLEPV